MDVLCRGSLHVPVATQLSQSTACLPDSYLSVQTWGKGLAFVNGFNLGCYWPLKGPANTMYVPGALLHTGNNDLVLLEIEHAPSHHTGALLLGGQAQLTTQSGCHNAVQCSIDLCVHVHDRHYHRLP